MIKKPHHDVDKEGEDVGTIEAGEDNICRTHGSITTQQTGTRPMTMSDVDRVRQDVDSALHNGSDPQAFTVNLTISASRGKYATSRMQKLTYRNGFLLKGRMSRAIPLSTA